MVCRQQVCVFSQCSRTLGSPRYGVVLFTKAILEGKPIQVFNNGHMVRDFTYVDDIIESLIRRETRFVRSRFNPQAPNPSTSWAPHRVFNIGNSNPTPLMEYIHALEQALGITAEKQMMPMQPVTCRQQLPTPLRWRLG